MIRALLFGLLIAASANASDRIPSPLEKTIVSSGFGLRVHPIRGDHRFHQGVDLAAKEGTPIFAVSNGVVTFAGVKGGYGNLIVVRHTERLITLYGHCKRIEVRVGKRVKRGTVLGTVGKTGAVTGPHLHFEVRYDGKPQAPEDIFKLRLR